MRFLIVSCSLDPDSRSRVLAVRASELVMAAGHGCTLVDLRSTPLPPFDNRTAFDHPSYRILHDQVAAADGILLAAPVYNWGLGGGVKTLIELTGAQDGTHRSAWFDKLVTFVCAGGLPHSYTAYLPTANALMLDFKCVLNPHMTYATDRDWREDDQMSDTLRERLDRTVAIKLDLAAALRDRRYRSDWEV